MGTPTSDSNFRFKNKKKQKRRNASQIQCPQGTKAQGTKEQASQIQKRRNASQTQCPQGTKAQCLSDSEKAQCLSDSVSTKDKSAMPLRFSQVNLVEPLALPSVIQSGPYPAKTVFHTGQTAGMSAGCGKTFAGQQRSLWSSPHPPVA